MNRIYIFLRYWPFYQSTMSFFISRYNFFTRSIFLIISITTSVFFKLLFSMNIFFQSFTFICGSESESLIDSLWSNHGCLFSKTHSANLCPLIEYLNSFTFKVIIAKERLNFYHFITHFLCLSYIFVSQFPITSFFCV